MKMNNLEDSEDLRALRNELRYSIKTGNLYWTTPKVNRDMTKPIGENTVSRYKVITYKQVQYLQHKLIWYLIKGIYPVSKQIDHINQNTKDNRIQNLRLVTAQENSRNKPKRRDNVTGITGVSLDGQTQMYRGSIKDNNGKYIRSRRFRTIEEAETWRNQKALEFGYFENHGRELSRLPYRQK